MNVRQERMRARWIVGTAALLLAAPAARATPAQESPPAEIVVEGSGEARAAPDEATLTLSVVTRAPTAAAAAAANAPLQQAVLEALHAADVAEEALATTGYGVQPEYDREGRRTRQLVGYVARAQLRVGPVAPARIGTLIDTALAAGADGIDAIRFDSSRRAGLRREALMRAVRDARAAAEAIAEAAGGKLGALLLVSTPAVQAGGMVVRSAYRPSASAEGAVPTPIQAGEIVVRAQVETRWRFEPSR